MQYLSKISGKTFINAEDLQASFKCLLSIEYILCKYFIFLFHFRLEKNNSLGITHFLAQPVPSDYGFLPISILYRSSLAVPTSNTPVSNNYNADDMQAVVSQCLQWCYLMECWRKDVICCISPDTLFCHLVTVFLTATDLFLNVEVRSYLEGCFRKEAERKHMSQLKLDKNPLPGIASFYDMYVLCRFPKKCFVLDYSCNKISDALNCISN